MSGRVLTEWQVIEEMARALVPALDGAAHMRLCAATDGLPCNHPLALLALQLHCESAERYPSFAALSARVEAGDEPDEQEWAAAIDADRAKLAADFAANVKGFLLALKADDAEVVTKDYVAEKLHALLAGKLVLHPTVRLAVKGEV